MADYLLKSGARFVVRDGLNIAGIRFGDEFLDPALSAHPQYFTRLKCWQSPETCVYEIRVNESGR
jgi:hypothetical protein